MITSLMDAVTHYIDIQQVHFPRPVQIVNEIYLIFFSS